MDQKYIPLMFRGQNRTMRCPFCNWAGTANDIIKSQKGIQGSIKFLCPKCELPKYKQERNIK